MIAQSLPQTKSWASGMSQKNSSQAVYNPSEVRIPAQTLEGLWALHSDRHGFE